MSGDPHTRGKLGTPRPERGRSASEASRVWITASRFDRTKIKTARARRLRRAEADVERRLSQRLRIAQIGGASFRRQQPAGNTILDFYCPALCFAIELDGRQHSRTADQDRQRDEWLRQRRVTLLRFCNSDMTENRPGVLAVIGAKLFALKSKTLIPTRRGRADLPLSGGGTPSARRG